MTCRDDNDSPRRSRMAARGFGIDVPHPRVDAQGWEWRQAMDNGIHNITRAEYDAIEAVNASLLKCADRSMAHAKAYMDGYRKTSEALAFGSAYHAYILERERFDKEFVTIPKVSRATKAGKDAWAEAVERAGSEDRVIWAEDVATFEAMREALHRSAPRRKLCTEPGRYEVCVVWDCEGTRCKALIDKLIPTLNIALDLKKATDAREFAFASAAARYGYDIQAAFYLDGIKAATGEDYDFAFLAQEDEPPFESAMYAITWGSETHMTGRKKYRDLLASVETCKRLGKWPGYGDDVIDLILPKWAQVA